MTFVEIYKLNNDGSQSVIATCTLENKNAICEGDSAFIKNLDEEGIKNYEPDTDKKVLFPKDGIKFLEQLKYNFTSGYLNASDIKEK